MQVRQKSATLADLGSGAMVEARQAAKEAPGRAICADCGLDLTERKKWRAGPVVHCDGPIWPPLRTRQAHHGRRRWRCPRCERPLGCDYCARTPDDLLCPACEVHPSGRSQIKFSPLEKKALIAFVGHTDPARAIALGKLSDELNISERRAVLVVETLLHKGVTLRAEGERYWLDINEVNEPEPRASGIELGLPFRER